MTEEVASVEDAASKMRSKNDHSLQTIVTMPVRKTCRHRQYSTSGKCLNCGTHRPPVPAIGHDVLPSAALMVRI